MSRVNTCPLRLAQGPQGEDAITEETRRLLVPRSPEVFAYDLDGNLTGDGRWSFTWDGENRLVAMETPAALVDPAGPLPLAERRRLEFAYDAGGRRLSKKVYSWDGAAWTLATHRVFLYDGWNMAAEYRVAPDGVSLTLERSATWGLDLSGSMQGAGGVAGLLWIGDATATYAAAYDGNGNVTALVDSVTGTIGGDFEYGPFGEPLKASGPAVSVSPFRFSTKYTDDETDLVYYGFRYYNPSTGRWLSKDPIEEEGGVNLYGMVGNNPISAADALGLCDCRSMSEANMPALSSDLLADQPLPLTPEWARIIRQNEFREAPTSMSEQGQWIVSGRDLWEFYDKLGEVKSGVEALRDFGEDPFSSPENVRDVIDTIGNAPGLVDYFRSSLDPSRYTVQLAPAFRRTTVHNSMVSLEGSESQILTKRVAGVQKTVGEFARAGADAFVTALESGGKSLSVPNGIRAGGSKLARNLTADLSINYHSTTITEFVWVSEEQKCWYQCLTCNGDEATKLRLKQRLLSANQIILEKYKAQLDALERLHRLHR